MAEAAHKQRLSWADMVQQESDLKWMAWVDMSLASGASRAHRWTRNSTQHMPTPVEQAGAVEEQTEFWKKLWNRDHAEHKEILKLLQHMRCDLVMDRNREPYQRQWLEKALHKAIATTGQ